MDLVGTNKHRLVKAADLIVTSATFNVDKELADFEFQRIIADEAYLLGSASMLRSNLCRLTSQRRWCVTASPCDYWLPQLSEQLAFLAS
jgi:hypothetical protein